MAAEHIEILVEEPSMEAFLRASLPSLVGQRVSYEIYPYQGKSDLLNCLESRLRGYAAWLPATWRVIVVVDRDDEDCDSLKATMETICVSVGLSTRSQAGEAWRTCFRIAVEELEAWYFGEWEAVRTAYPRLKANVARKAAYRLPDAIRGGTWEAFERELQRATYFVGGLRKIEAARSVGAYFRRDRCTSPSYQCLAAAIEEAVG